LKLLSTTFALAIADTPLAAQHLTLRLLDHLVVTEATHPDLPLREISGNSGSNLGGPVRIGARLVADRLCRAAVRAGTRVLRMP
jgi:hypothetical protein